MFALSGRTALVTGGSRGIGTAVAERLAHDGADIAITYRNATDHASDVAERIEAIGRRAVTIKADAADPRAATEAVTTATEELGALDILVANAGVFPNGPLDEVPLDEIERTIAIHVTGVFLAAQAAAARLPDGGRIILIGSCLAERVPAPGTTLYAMTKSALTGLTKGLARDLGSRSITANVVHPGPTDTDMNPADGAHADGERELTALGRYGTGMDIAASVAFLASEQAAWITGAAIAVDGGYTA